MITLAALHQLHNTSCLQLHERQILHKRHQRTTIRSVPLVASLNHLKIFSKMQASMHSLHRKKALFIPPDLPCPLKPRPCPQLAPETCSPFPQARSPLHTTVHSCRPRPFRSRSFSLGHTRFASPATKSIQATLWNDFPSAPSASLTLLPSTTYSRPTSLPSPLDVFQFLLAPLIDSHFPADPSDTIPSIDVAPSPPPSAAPSLGTRSRSGTLAMKSKRGVLGFSAPLTISSISPMP